MSEKRLLSSLNESESVKEIEKNFDDARIKKSKKDFNELRDGFFKSKIKHIRKDIYVIENKKYISTPRIKEIDKNLIELENNISKLKKYYDHDYIEYKGIRDLRNLFDLSLDEDYHKPIKTDDAFNSNYVEYVNEMKTKLYQLKNIFM